MTKKYSSSARIVLSVVAENGGNMRIAFTPLTGGGSFYTTSDEKVQRAIECDANFGKTFIGTIVPDATSPAPIAVEKPAVKTVAVTSINDAKDYLADRFGYSRTKLRSKDAIIAAGVEHGIEFKGI